MNKNSIQMIVSKFMQTHLPGVEFFYTGSFVWTNQFHDIDVVVKCGKDCVLRELTPSLEGKLQESNYFAGLYVSMNLMDKVHGIGVKTEISEVLPDVNIICLNDREYEVWAKATMMMGYLNYVPQNKQLRHSMFEQMRAIVKMSNECNQLDNGGSI